MRPIPCPVCRARKVNCSGDEYRCSACDVAWDSLLKVAETKPKTSESQHTLVSASDPGDTR